MRWIEKCLTALLMVSTFSITMQSFGEVKLHAPAVGVKILFFLFVMLGLPVRGGQFEQVLCVDLWVDFDAVFTAFSAVIALSEALESSRTHC